MRPTRRGAAAIGIAIVAIVLGVAFGPRALNAVAAPLLGAVVFGALQVWRAEDPTIRCSPVDPGFPGAERVARLEADGSGVLAVHQTWPDGLEAQPIDAVLTPPESIERTLVLGNRGRYTLDPPTVRQRDGLGLVSTPVTVDEGGTVLIYPEIYRGVSASPLSRLVSGEVLAERQEFDRLREYTPGDPLRDVHWKSSAKRDEFLVTEFEPGDRSEAITIAARAEAGAADDMATAAGTIALVALEAGLAVGLAIPGDRVSPDSGRTHAANLLDVLAGATHGEPDDIGDASVRIEAGRHETLVTVEDATYRFADLIDDPHAMPAREVAVA